MFVALRDLRHARGRFALMLVVITLITFLVTFLASLTEGLSRESTSAITELPADHLVFAMPNPTDAPDFTASAVTGAQWQAWASVPGVVGAEPLGVATSRAHAAATTAAVTAFGVQTTSALLPDGSDLAPGTAILSAGAASALSVAPGDAVTLGGHELRVRDVLDADVSYAHTPVVWTTLADWQAVGAPGAIDGQAPVATVIALTTADVTAGAIGDADLALGTTTVTTGGSLSAISSYSSENGSLTLMQVFLLAISALVVGAFFTVWTISRSGDVAVLKALGASTGYLLRDAIGQALGVLVVGVGVGAGLASVGALALRGAVPVVVSPATTLLPAAALIVLGLTGATLAIVRITRVDPHAALAAR